MFEIVMYFLIYTMLGLMTLWLFGLYVKAKRNFEEREEDENEFMDIEPE